MQAETDLNTLSFGAIALAIIVAALFVGIIHVFQHPDWLIHKWRRFIGRQ